jgi:phenylacetate-CoA ligase
MARLKELRQSQHLSTDELQAIQLRKLRRLLTIANEHCPFYAERIRSAELAPDDTTLVLEDLQRLPTLSRGDIREHLNEMTWFGSPSGGPQPYNTGGSSGEPLKFYFDRSRQAADWAARWRAREKWGVRPGDPEILLWGAPVELRAQDRLRQGRDSLLNQEMLNAFDMTQSTMDAYVDRIRNRRPVCLYGYASSLALLARHALDRGLDAGGLGSDRLRAVFVTGEVMPESDRGAIETAFGVPAVVEYGCRDGGLLAFGCPGGQLHVPMENVIVELLDSDGNTVQPGEVGEVTVTHLEAFAMPIIRYRTGDLARAVVSSNDDSIGRKCACGSSLIGLAEVRGRVTDQIVRRDGDQLRRMHALALMYVVREVDGVCQFRITQPSLDRLDIDIVPDDRFTPQMEDTLEAGLRDRMGEDVDIQINRRDHIPPTASGKHACVVSHV